MVHVLYDLLHLLWTNSKQVKVEILFSVRRTKEISKEIFHISGNVNPSVKVKIAKSLLLSLLFSYSFLNEIKLVQKPRKQNGLISTVQRKVSEVN